MPSFKSDKDHTGYPDTTCRYISTIILHPIFSFFSSALFAFWLRSSVVSVLFSLISEILLREKSMIKFIFVFSERSSGLAHDLLHCVPGLTLPLGDANLFFISVLSSPESLKKKKARQMCAMSATLHTYDVACAITYDTSSSSSLHRHVLCHLKVRDMSKTCKNL